MTTKTVASVVGTAIVAGVSAVVLAQGAKPPVIATDITAAEVEAVVKHPTGGTDRLSKAALDGVGLPIGRVDLADQQCCRTEVPTGCH